MKTDQAGIDFIKRFEGFRSEAYQDGAGVWTIGFGHTDGVGPNWAAISEKEAEVLLREDLRAGETAIQKYVTVPLNQNEFNALSSFAFNEGIGRILSSTLMKLLNRGDRKGAAGEFGRWVYLRDPKTNQEVVSDGLMKRRAAESILFLSPV